MVQVSKMAQATKNTITLKGSTKIVTEFFAYAVNRYACGDDVMQLLASNLSPFTQVYSCKH